MNRRRFLCSLGALSLAGASAGCSSTRPPQSTPPDARSRPPRTPSVQPSEPKPITDIVADWGFERVVNLVDAGADPTGSRRIDEQLAESMTDGTLVFLPQGRYRIEEPVLADGIPRLGIIGRNATIVPPEGFEDTLFGLGWPTPGSDLLFAGIDFDFTAPDTGGRPVLANASNRVVVRNVEVRGVADVDQDLVRIDVTDSEGTGRVERLSLPDGALPDSPVTGCEVGSDNRGDLEFVDCHIAGFPDNGLYADPPTGSVLVEGGTYLNNGVAGVRVEGTDSCTVRGVYVGCDTTDGGENMRGIRLRGGTEVTVENCHVDLRRVTGSDGAIVFASELGAATVRNCRLRVDADGVNAIRIKSSESGNPTFEGPFRCENVNITGTAAGGAAVNAANRDGCYFSNICVHQTGDDRDGFVFDNVDGELLDSYVSVTGQPLTFTQSAITRRNVTIGQAPPNSSKSGAGPCQ